MATERFKPRTAPELPPVAIDMASVERRMFDKLYATTEVAPSADVSSSARLLAALTTRLTTVEASQRVLRAELVEKDREILRLRAQLADATVSEGGTDGLEIQALRTELAEIKSFLADYGLEWVGGSAADASGKERTASIDVEQLDLPVLMLRLRQLNVLAGEGKSQVQREGNAAKLVAVASVPLVVYRDGIVLRNGPFRPFSEVSCAAFVEDVLDGYFPYELKAEFPSGTAFALVDKTTLTFSQDTGPSRAATTAAAAGTGSVQAPAPSFQAFTGHGSRVAASAEVGTKPSSSDSREDGGQRLSGALGSLATVGAPDVPLLSAESLLGALPGTRIRDGRVIDVRAGIAQLLLPPPIVIHSQALATARHSTAPPPASTSVQVRDSIISCSLWLNCCILNIAPPLNAGQATRCSKDSHTEAREN
jgi:hypothetical protein